MELRKVVGQDVKEYAKKESITKTQLKKVTPNKWIAASAAGLVTLLYTSPKNSINKIGVVIGCVSLAVGEITNYTSTFKVLNTTMDIFYYISWFLGILFVVFFVHHNRNEKKYSDEERKKSIQNVKTIGIVLIFCAIITSLLIVIIKQDVPAFYEGGKPNYVYKSTYTSTDSIDSTDSTTYTQFKSLHDMTKNY